MHTTRRVTVDLGISDEHVAVSDHIAYFWETEEQFADAVRGAFQRAIDGGAPLVRLLGNLGWGHRDWPTDLDILEFESKVTGACRSFPCVVVCMYDYTQLSGRIVVHGAYETHPLTVCGNVLRENPHHLAIDTFLAKVDKARAEKVA